MRSKWQSSHAGIEEYGSRLLNVRNWRRAAEVADVGYENLFLIMHKAFYVLVSTKAYITHKMYGVPVPQI